MKRDGIDLGVLIYLGLINTLIEKIKHPENKDILLQSIYEHKKHVEKKFRIKIVVNSHGLLEIEGKAPASARGHFFGMFLDLMTPLEEKYGVDKTWPNFWSYIEPVYNLHKPEIKEMNLEIPLHKFSMKIMFLRSLKKKRILEPFFGKISDEKWSDGKILVTNLKLVVESEAGSAKIGVEDVMTAGREVYSDIELSDSSRSAKMMDYKTPLGVSSIIYDGPEETVNRFNTVVSRAKAEYKGLTEMENKILSVLNMRRQLSSLVGDGGTDQKTLAQALEKLRRIGYITADYELTSYGVNALSDVLGGYSP